MQPFLLAEALRRDGWYLRQIIVWARPNAMPESVRDRCTTSHSYVLLLSKQPRYFFDADAIAEPAAWERWGDQTVPKYEGTDTASGWMQSKTRHELVNIGNRSNNECTDERRGFDQRLERADRMKNARSVWTIPTQGYPEAHFATFPEELVRRMILAGSSEMGVCGTCGKPRERLMSSSLSGMRTDRKQINDGFGVKSMGGRADKATATAGWTDCDCRAPCPVHDFPGGFCIDCPDQDPALKYRPAVVLDPFMGSGTTALVARKHGRHAIGIELNETYCRMAAERLQQLSLLAEAARE